LLREAVQVKVRNCSTNGDVSGRDDQELAAVRLEGDDSAMDALRRLASGESGALCCHVRNAAAGLLIAAGVDWSRLRLLAIAANKAPSPTSSSSSRSCPAANLSPDLARLIMRWHFLLGSDSVRRTLGHEK